jgi:hypothetical protein
MPVEKTLIELSEKDLKEVLCKYYGLHEVSATISIYQYKGDAREPSYSTITITGVKQVK